MNSFQFHIAAVSAALLPNVAGAELGDEIFAELAPEACVVRADGVRVVRPEFLAYAIAQIATVPFDLVDRANATGRSDGRADAEDYIYIVTHAAHRPFGPGAQSQRMRDANQRLNVALGHLFHVGNAGRTSDGNFQRGGTNTSPNYTDFFTDPDRAYFICNALPQSTEPDASDQPERPNDIAEAIDFIDEHFLLRGKVSDLTVTSVPLTTLSSATLSFRRNNQDEESQFSISGVAGLRFQQNQEDAHLLYNWEFIPYISYQRTDWNSDRQDQDVHQITPGFILQYDSYEPSLNFAASVASSMTFDLEQHARRFNLETTFTPQIEIGNFGTGRFGPTIGPVSFRPAISLIGEASYILDPGDSAELAGADSYVALGGIASLGAYFPDVPILEDFTTSVSYRHLQVVGGDNSLTDLSHFDASVQYAIAGSENASISFTYISGENLNTLQDEEAYTVSLGLRF